MPKKLDDNDKTMTVQIKMTETMKEQALRLSKFDGDGDLSGWIRSLIRREWKSNKNPFRVAYTRK